MSNYFELYEIPQSFHPDAAVVKQKYYELSRTHHPDRYAQAEKGKADEALRMAALNNQAYKTLTNADATMAYILKLNNMLEEEEKYTLPPAFLMEMMDLNEAVSDAEDDPESEEKMQTATASLQEQYTQIDNELQPLTERYDKGEYENIQELLGQIKDQYFRKKYLLRIKERIAKFAAP